MGYRIGVDVGGTFTDLVLLDDSGGSTVLFKLPSTPDDPSQAIVAGIRELLGQTGLRPDDIGYLNHGTTVATNAMIERRWPKTALLTTDGFRDVIEIRRQQRPDTYDLYVGKPPQIATRDLRCEVRERTLADGSIERPVDEQEVRALVRDLKRQGVETIAICFLHSYVNGANEETVAQLVQDEFPEASVTVSSRLVPEYREYPRVSTTLVNACLQPVMGRYLSHLEEQVEHMGMASAPRILLSHGGVVSARTAGQEPVRTLVSGPSAGVIGAAMVCGLAGAGNLVTFDMGGTSTDVCLVNGGVPAVTREKEIAGYPVKTGMVDVHSVGAGGGSIAWVDSGGFLQVGPQSAGAAPGPASYGHGGEEPAVTDANLLLGRLSPRGLLSGRMPLFPDRAEQAISRFVARPLDLSPVEAAYSIIRIVNANIVKAIRLISVEKGYDPRDFMLVAFGGAGPAHATALATELGFPGVLIPPSPGILCALGLLVADTRTEFSRTRILPAHADSEQPIEEIFLELEQQARAWLRQEAPDSTGVLQRLVDMRYVGQSFELTVPLTGAKLSVQQMVDLFYAEHQRTYGYHSAAQSEFITFRVQAQGIVPKPNFEAAEVAEAAVPEPSGRRAVYFDDTRRAVDCPIFDRAQLLPGHRFEGPAVVDEMDSTILIPPDWQAHLDRYDVIHLKQTGGQP